MLDERWPYNLKSNKNQVAGLEARDNTLQNTPTPKGVEMTMAQCSLWVPFLLVLLVLSDFESRPNKNKLLTQAFQLQPTWATLRRSSKISQTTTTQLYVKTPEEKTELLRQLLGVDQHTVQTIVEKNPHVIRYKHERIMKQIKWYQDYLNINEAEIVKMFINRRLEVYVSIESKEEKLAAFQSILGLDASQVKKLIRKRPVLLGYSLNNLEDKVKFFAQIFGYDTETDRPKIGKGFLRNPTVLSLTKENIISKVDWYRTTLGLDKVDKWMKRLFKNVTLLCLNVESLEMKRLWLKDRLDLDEAQIAQIVRRHPNVLSRSIEHSLEPKLQWIERRFKIRDKKALGTMIYKLPTILAYSIEANLEPTLDFWTNEIMGGDESKALKLLAHDPMFLGYSLERRLLPRWKQYQELGFTGRPSWNAIFRYPNDKWEAYLERTCLKNQVDNDVQW